MTRTSERSAAALNRWAAFEVGGRVHLVGVLVGSHPRLPADAWVITSPVRNLNLATMTAVTASTGRRYLLGERLDGRAPSGAQDVIARAMTSWRLAGPPPAAPLTDAEIVRLLAATPAAVAPADDGTSDDACGAKYRA
jgi:hypothetical protein